MELGELDEVSFGRRFSFVELFGEAADAAGDGYQASQRRHNYLNGYSIESFVVNQRGSPVGIKKKIKKELIGPLPITRRIRSLRSPISSPYAPDLTLVFLTCL